MKTIEIDRDIFEYLATRAAESGDSPAGFLRRELKIPPATESLEVDDETYAHILSRSVVFGESPSRILRRELELGGEPPQPRAPAVVLFRIPGGVGNGRWNTQDAMLVAKLGDTLRITNDDAVPHRLHTSGAPFPHPNTDIAPGESAEYVLVTPFDPAIGGPLYNHNAGPGAEFWIKVEAVA